MKNKNVLAVFSIDTDNIEVKDIIEYLNQTFNLICFVAGPTDKIEKFQSMENVTTSEANTFIRRLKLFDRQFIQTQLDLMSIDFIFVFSDKYGFEKEEVKSSIDKIDQVFHNEILIIKNTVTNYSYNVLRLTNFQLVFSPLSFSIIFSALKSKLAPKQLSQEYFPHFAKIHTFRSGLNLKNL